MLAPMTHTETDGEIRQSRHQIRARRARWAGRLLIPVLGLLVSASLWSDPKIANELKRGLAVIAHLTSSGQDTETADSANYVPTKKAQQLPSVSQLPQSRVKVNRLP